MLSVDFGSSHDDAETSEIEADGAKVGVLQLLPQVAGGCIAVDASEDEGCGAGHGTPLGERRGAEDGVEEVRVVTVDEGVALGGGNIDDGGRGTRSRNIGLHGGRSAAKVKTGGFGPVGDAEEEAEILGGESALGIILVEAGDAGDEGLS